MVSIRKLRFAGLYSYGSETTLDLSEHTIIVGPNNSGKSNIFRMVQLMIDSLYKNKRLLNSEISHKGKDLFLEISLVLSDDEVQKIVDSWKFYPDDQHSNTKYQLIQNEKQIKEFVNEITIRLSWERTLDDYGSEAFLEIIFEKGNFKLSNPMRQGNFLVSAIDFRPSSQTYHEKKFHNFLEILTSNSENSVEEFFKENQNKFVILKPFRAMDHELPTAGKLLLREVLAFVDISPTANIDVSIVNVIGKILKLGVNYATENRGLLPNPLINYYDIFRHTEYSPSLVGEESERDRFDKTLWQRAITKSLQYTHELKHDGSNLAEFLFSLRNSSNYSDRKKYEDISNGFESMFENQKLSVDVILHYETDPRSNRWNDKESRSPLYPKIIILDRKLDKHLPLDQVGAGVREVLYLLTTSYGVKNSVILLDEPGVNLHPSILQTLMRKLENSENENQFLITTHSPELVYYEMFEGSGDVIYVKKPEEESIVEVLSPENKAWFNENRSKFKHQIDPRIFFGKCIILTEGESDRNLTGIIQHFESEENEYDLTSHDVVLTSIGSKFNFEKYQKLLQAYSIDYVILADADSKDDVFKDTETSIINKNGLEIKNRIFIIENGDLERLMEDIDSDSYEKAKQFGGRSKPAVSQRFAELALAKNPDALKPIQDFIKFSIDITKSL